MWFGTARGLIKYDGYSQERIKSLRDERVNAVYTDSRGWLWVGTEDNGLICVNLHTGQIVEDLSKNDRSAVQPLSGSTVTKIYEDSRRHLWVCTNAGVNKVKFGAKGELVVEELKIGDDESSNLKLSVTTAIEDSAHRMWFGTREGHLLNLSSQRIVVAEDFGFSILSVAADPHDPESLLLATSKGGILHYNYVTRTARAFEGSEDLGMIRSMLLTSDKLLWVTSSDGLTRIDLRSGDYTRYQNDSSNHRSLSSNFANSLFEDKNNVLWVGTDKGSVSRFNLKQRWFPHFLPSKSRNFTLRNDKIVSLCASKSGSFVWVGTSSDILMFDPAAEEFYPIERLDRVENQAFFDVYTVFEDSAENLWIGAAGGLTKLHIPTKNVNRFDNHQVEPGSNWFGAILSIAEDSQKNIWIGSSTEGVTLFDTRAEVFSRFHSQAEAPNRIPSDRISVIECDSHGDVWIGTKNKGILYKRRNGEEFQYLNLPGNPVAELLSTAHITSLFVDRLNFLWVGTKRKGLFSVSPERNVLRQFSTANSGIASNYICGVEQDITGNYWIATGDNGVSRLSHDKQGFLKYDTANGLQSLVFSEGAVLRSSEEKIYLGGSNGFNIVDPLDLPKEVNPSWPILTGLEINGKREVPGAEGSILDLPIARLEKCAAAV